MGSKVSTCHSNSMNWLYTYTNGHWHVNIQSHKKKTF